MLWRGAALTRVLIGSTALMLLASPAIADSVVTENQIVQGNLCVGIDCVDGETFGFTTLKLKQNTNRILFDDTSGGSFPSNDWQLIANDQASGGRNFFGIEDVSGGTIPFFVAAGARANALFLASSGRVGFGTDNPGLALHAQNDNTPGLRLEQTNAGGFTAQTWDVAGNEANFFVRDLTGGSRLPFRIRPGAPTSSIDIAASGFVGLGTATPQANLHVFGAASADSFATFGTNAGGALLNAGGPGAHGLNIGQAGTTFAPGTSVLNAFAEDGASGRLILATNGAGRVTIDGAGRVGIGTAAPGAQLATTGTVRFSGIAGCASGLVTNGTGDLACSGALALIAADNSVFNSPPTAAGANAVAGGFGASASAANATAFGNGALASAAGAVALGQGSIATLPNTVSLGAPGAERRIVNLAAGSLAPGSTDAVNGSQLLLAAQRVAATLGGGAGVDGSGVLTAPSYTVQGQAFTNVGGALTRLDQQVTTATAGADDNAAGLAALQTAVAGGTIGLVQQEPTSRALAVGGATDGLVVAFAGTTGDRRLTGVAAGTAGNDAVTLAQLTSAVGTVSSAIGSLPLRSNNASGLSEPSAGGSDALALGFGANAEGRRGVAVGGQAVASAVDATALGSGARASFAGATAVGAGARAVADPTTAVGFEARATADEASAFGAFAAASGVNSTALGRSAEAAGRGATAVGFQASAMGDASLALGQNAAAPQPGAVAIGQGVRTTRAQQVAIGSTQNTYTLAGIASEASRSSLAGPVRFVIADDAGNLATGDVDLTGLSTLNARVDGLGSRVDGLGARVGAVENRVDALSAQVGGLAAQAWQMSREMKRAHEGSAIAMAMGGATLPAGKTYAVSANWGTYRGENGFAASAVVRVSDFAYVNAGLGVGGRGSVGGRAGVTFAW